jgi:hypothetical protein
LRWCDGAGPRASRVKTKVIEVDWITRVRLAVLERTIATGLVPSAGELAAQLQADEAAVVDAYGKLHESHVYVLEPSDPTRLRMANPFSAVPTPFKVTEQGRGYFGNCVWDALGIISLLGGNGTVETSCPDCNEPLRLRVEGRELVEAGGVAHFSVPARRWWDDIVFT